MKEEQAGEERKGRASEVEGKGGWCTDGRRAYY